MYRVIVPVDRDVDRAEKQARYVERLAREGAAVEATVLWVVAQKRLVRAVEDEFADVESAVAAADRLEAAGVPVERVVGDGEVSQEVVRVADESDADEIVMGGRKRTGVTQVILGSTVHDVVLSAERPVTVAGRSITFGAGRRTLLLPVDHDVDRALHQAGYVADLPTAPDDLEVTVLHVFPHQDYEGAPPHEFEEVEAAVEAAVHLETAGIEVDRVAVGGEVVETIVEMADDLRVDSIVVGGRKRSGVQKVVMGSTSMDAILSATRPVTITG